MSKRNGNNRNGNNGNKRSGEACPPKRTGRNMRGQQRVVTSGTPFREDFNRRDSSRNVRREAEIADTGAAMSRSNPVAYYTKFSKFARDAANLPFSLPLGDIFNVYDAGSTIKVAIPGVARVQFIPAIGVSKDFTSAINRSSIRFYTYLRSNQKASAKYDHQDISMMEVALDSCYMFHAMLRRLYGIVRDFTPVNEYYSRTLVAATGAIFNDVKANLQDLRAYVNTFAYQLGQYALPAGITLFDRHRWMCEGLYTDGTSEKAQTYMFVPAGFYQYDNTVETGSQCVFKEYLPAGTATKQYTVAELMQFGNELINAVSNDADFATISGDIYNYYGGETYKLPYVDENYIVVPAYSEVVLSQIENATIVALNRDSLTISQNPDVNEGAIMFTPGAAPATRWFGSYMNFHHDSPSSDDVIEASRLMVIPSDDRSNGILNEIEMCGTEIVVQLDIFNRNPETGAFRFNPITAVVHPLTSTATLQEVKAEIRDILHLAQFDWAPGVRVHSIVPDPNFSDDFLGWTWDIANFQFVDNMYLKQIHLACLLSLFEVGTNDASIEGVSVSE